MRTEKIDLILTKEVGRFARNTVDTLNLTRRLSELKIGVIFMNDGIDTRDKDGEMRLKIMSSIAREESRKISEPMTQWKAYTPIVLAEKAKINRSDDPEAPFITIRDHREGIVLCEMRDATQAEMFRRSQESREGRKHSRTYWFSGN